MKNNLSLVSAGQMKRLVNASKYFVLIAIKLKENGVQNALVGCDLSHKNAFLELDSNYDDMFYETKGFPPKIEIEHDIYLQHSSS